MEKNSVRSGAKIQSIPQKQLSPVQGGRRDSVPTRQAIAERAYEKYRERGYRHGFDAEDWLAAERELAEMASTGQRH